MGILSKFEGGVEGAFEGAAGAVFRSPIEPAQIAKRAEKQMYREKLVGAGRQYAPTLYNVLVNPKDNNHLFGFYPTIAAEIETYLMGKGTEAGLEFDGRPLVRFIVDDKLKSGKFDVIAENIAAPIIVQLRQEEMEFYGIAPAKPAAAPAAAAAPLAAPEGSLRQAVRQAHSASFNDEPSEPDSLDDLSPDPNSPGAAFARSLGSAQLINTGSGKVHELERTHVVLGRETASDIVVNDANASRAHAQLSQDASGVWKLVDLDSTNGTLLNDRPVKQALLRDRDRITIGITVLEFRER